MACFEKFVNARVQMAGIILLFVLPVLFIVSSCNKNEGNPREESSFLLTSPAVGTDSLLPVDYTCDGSGSSLPVTWSGCPANTACFVLIMDHMASPTDIHWYWILYNIPASVTSLPENGTGIGTAGTNSVNGRTEYAPPCSQGPGRKDYVLTLYALSEPVDPSVPPEEVTREVMLDAIRNITLSSASMTAWYSRNVK